MMVTRLERLKWTDQDFGVEKRNIKDLFDLSDSALKTLLRVTDKELNFIIANTSVIEQELLSLFGLSLAEKRTLLALRNKLMSEFIKK
jgi:hypothetical protein